MEAVGGKENISSAVHCMTRLRLALKDEGKSSDEKLKAINGVIQVVYAGGQVQIVIGPGVDTVYDSFCEQTGLNKQSAVYENLDKPK